MPSLQCRKLYSTLNYALVNFAVEEQVAQIGALDTAALFPRPDFCRSLPADILDPGAALEKLITDQVLVLMRELCDIQVTTAFIYVTLISW